MTPPQTLRPPSVVHPCRSIESVLESRWARLLIPSLADLFFLAILVWLFMSSGGAGWSGLLADADVGWHIRTGEYILDHHTGCRATVICIRSRNRTRPGTPGSGSPT